jgi:hypothetical protein
VIDLGGSWDGNELSLDDARWRTLHDPEGNEFDIFVTGSVLSKVQRRARDRGDGLFRSVGPEMRLRRAHHAAPVTDLGAPLVGLVSFPDGMDVDCRMSLAVPLPPAAG